jgi:ribosomal protein L40E
MEETNGQPSVEICHRCLQPIAPSAQRCPNCGERHTRTHRFPIFIGIMGLLALLFVAFIMVRVIQNADIDSAPPDQTQTEDSAPLEPEKPPPFNP